ncbi:peptide methionine sulfoxide reductase MsrA [Haematococcus lacustris]
MRIWFDPDVITYTQVLERFFEEHDPTRKTKAQYKSGIWYHSEAQREAAQALIAALAARHGPVATSLEPEQPWTDAEEYHQDYINKMTGRSRVGAM